MDRALIWSLKRIHRWIPMGLLMIVAQVGSALLGVAFALGTREVIDTAVAGSPAEFRQACLIQGAIIAGMLLCNVYFRHLRDLLMAELDRDWKSGILRDLLHSDYASVSDYHSVELLNRLNNDVRILNAGLLEALPSVAALFVRLVAALAALVVLEPWFALGICAGGLVVIAVTGLARKNLKKLHKLVSEQEGRVSGFLQEVLEKLLMVQAMDVAGQIENRATDLMEQRFRAQRKRKNVSLLANSCVNLLSQGTGFVALIWCGGKLLRGQLSFGSLTAVTQLVSQLQAPFANLSAVFPKYVAMSAAAERLRELTLLEQEPEPVSRTREELYEKMTAIRARELRFSYDRDVLLDGVSLDIPKGVFAVITGPSGTGKSTLLKLLLGVFHPDSGELYLDMEGERLPADRTARRLFAYVPQGNLLLSGTVRENLMIANRRASAADIRQALYVSAVDDFLPQLPLGLDTSLGENGAGLSEGQAQRLAIARAVLGGAPVLLLDECTSALDEQTERSVLERIRAMKDRTCIAVTHRPASLEICDVHLHLHCGTVEERGLR